MRSKTMNVECPETMLEMALPQRGPAYALLESIPNRVLVSQPSP